MNEPWRVSLHGGHSRDYCEHADDDLVALLRASAVAGYRIFGVTEHAPRSEERFVYDTEREKGYDVARLASEFEAYAHHLGKLADGSEDRERSPTVLRGFEVEVVPTVSYAEEMRGLRQHHAFEYIVGSVHHVDEMSIDSTPEDYASAVEASGGIENLVVRYYEHVARLVDDLEPEVVGHLDLYSLHAPRNIDLATRRIRDAAGDALEVIADRGSIVDVNTAGYRKGLGRPYPATWIVEHARDRGIPFCFGDDSHRVGEVGAGIDDARRYLLLHGVSTVTVLNRIDGEIVRETVRLDGACGLARPI